MKYILVIFIFCFSAYASSPEVSTCLLRTLKSIYTEIETGVLNAKERDSISAIFKRSDLTSREMAKKAFDIVLNARLNQLPDNIATKVRNAIKERSIYVNHAKNYNGHGINKTIKVIGPKELRETLVHYSAYLHELEHVIIDYKLDEFPRIKLFFQKQLTALGDRVFFDEKLSMRAEWEFLNSIPESVRDDMIKEIMIHPTLKERSKEEIIRSLKNSSLPIDDYLNDEWKAGRYDKSNAVLSILTSTQRFGQKALLITGSTIVGFSLSKIYSYCDRTKKGVIYEKICKHFGF